jgi:internalin A
MKKSLFVLAAIAIAATGCEDDKNALLARFDAQAPKQDAAAAAVTTAATASAAPEKPKKPKPDCSKIGNDITFADKALEKEVLFKLSKDAGSHVTRGELATIKSLNLTRYGKIEGLDPCVMPLMTGLKDLFVGEGDFDDLSPVADLTGLVTLRAAINKVSNLQPIEKLTRLDRLDISKTAVTDLKSVAYLPNLTEIALDDTDVLDLGPLKSCTKLEQLSIKNTPIKDLSPLKDIKTLKKIWIKGSGVTDYSALLPQTQRGLKIITTD